MPRLVIWFLVVCFARHADVASVCEPLLGTVEGLFYSVKIVIFGVYLLIAGFASHKPVSPEMDRALDGYLSAFAGEE